MNDTVTHLGVQDLDLRSTNDWTVGDFHVFELFQSQSELIMIFLNELGPLLVQLLGLLLAPLLGPLLARFLVLVQKFKIFWLIDAV